MSRTRIVFSGSGGQGVITAAIILAEAAVIYEGMNATQSQSYGAAARGGATRSDVILDWDEIDFPGVSRPNILIALTQTAYNNFSSIIRPGGMLLTDTKYVTTARKIDARQIELPIYETIMEKIGKPIVFNISVLGALIGITPLVEKESLLKAIKTRVPRDFVQLNIDAFAHGFELGKEFAIS
ncbi:MAG: 2-oxoglutarate ferredoxin oxidoreductase subunit gamma [Deltaproteobacteria bacterium]|nr:MAG: 2-oxoglutarate ferredoxin oxidoreductase subunit gamma [Deltaproteobacteria bacterium]PIE73276.1 MAG: 2-oxoglutarate ferredoxin oxidoreductase subunit gamma [Deltaproteobacteria bacterium]